MINASTEHDTLPGPSDPTGAEPAPRGRRLWWALAIVGLVLVGGGIASALIEVPYYALSPGQVWPTGELVEVGDDTPTYEPRGDIGFTTVSLKQASALEAFLGWLDPAVKVVPREDILGDQSPEQNRQQNLEFMADSKTRATAVALDALGYDVVSGNGAEVLEVSAGYPAEGLLEAGDVVTAVDGEEIELWDELVSTLGAREPGDVVTLTVTDAEGEDRREVSVELAAREDAPDEPILGIRGQTHDMSFDFPFEVGIESGDVGGPSAGLAFTLSILDVLTPEDLTGGNYVATTGTINLDGSVGPVGGVEQKTVAARRAGVDLFIVPAFEYDEAARVAGDMQVERVETLEDALGVLDSVGGESVALGEPSDAAVD